MPDDLEKRIDYTQAKKGLISEALGHLEAVQHLLDKAVSAAGKNHSAKQAESLEAASLINRGQIALIRSLSSLDI